MAQQLGSLRHHRVLPDYNLGGAGGRYSLGARVICDLVAGVLVLELSETVNTDLITGVLVLLETVNTNLIAGVAVAGDELLVLRGPQQGTHLGGEGSLVWHVRDLILYFTHLLRILIVRQ